MMLPTIHLNGTHPDALLEGLCEAASAIREAQEKLAAAAPNGRDYCLVQHTGAFEAAQGEHWERMERLRSVLKEVERIAEHVASAQGSRR